ncbi:MAG: ribonuclease E/G, partial [Candidatus Omnitrophica bacterium]|nr:ribonuclease E/G [Candidatus Omnitrophota bacterium]
LVVIDVNSGGFNAKDLTPEEMAFRINCEAAEEIARQLRLRDLGGIIVIDFIDMQKDIHRQKVLQVLKKALSKDRAKYDILGISRFGLIEMTRERIHKTLQMLTYQDCPYCQGKSKVKSSLSMSIYLFRELRRFFQDNPSVTEVEVNLNSSIYEEIRKSIELINQLEKKFNVKIFFKPNPSIHIEEVKILPRTK